jgi:hypothetical protein
MKGIYLYGFFALVLAVFSSCSGGSSSNSGSGADKSFSPNDTAKIWFRNYEHNFGKIESGEKVACIFTFENRGTGPLVLQSVSTSCGCTAPKYETKPVLPGKTGEIEVVFNSSGYNGMQSKTVTVRSNASDPYVLLKIVADVISSNN